MNACSADVVVIGAGHAGCEAAYTAARRGATTLLVTSDPSAVARMSCNPAIGGIAKGQIVREIDALGGLMGRLADATGVHFRMLNTSKGPAVRSLRVQADKAAYSALMRRLLLETPHLSLRVGEVSGVAVRDGRLQGVELSTGETVRCGAAIIAAGTFLQGLLHVGDVMTPGGRVNESPSVQLSASLKGAGLELHRLKTGTPPRVDGRTLELAGLEVQPSERDAGTFSYDTERVGEAQVNCHVTSTTAETHRIVRESLHLSPLYAGRIKGRGPRYCPSLEDKVARFPHRERHRLFLEPEGTRTHWVYVAGLSMSLPPAVQERVIHSIPGLGRCRILRYAYAVEYDFLPPSQIYPSLELRSVRGLYIAGQLNGTSGYEEAAGQGIMAGINASLALEGRDPVVLGRDQAYIGVLIDDLVVLNPTEPYRMFTSRAEHRLLLRHDNADRRLMRLGYRLGLNGEERLRRLEAKEEAIAGLKALLESTSENGVPLAHRLRRPGVSLRSLLDGRPHLAIGRDRPEVIEAVEIEVKYAGYIERAREHVDRMRRLEAVRIPAGIDYGEVLSLRSEARERLRKLRPATLGQASRIAGVSPADVALVWVHVRRMQAVSR
ncbi:MAG: tRNA uridine-5-carboxymethylaminomethyl(34) synthesis enzyme MnmG [Planctomycetota bacterium]